jgi:hypothetical protein
MSKKIMIQALQSDPFEVFKWPFWGSSGLELVIERALVSGVWLEFDPVHIFDNVWY